MLKIPFRLNTNNVDLKKPLRGKNNYHTIEKAKVLLTKQGIRHFTTQNQTAVDLH